MQARSIAKITLSIAVIAIVIGYSGFRFLDYTTGSHISIETPKSGSILHHPFVAVNGSADRISYISMNGQQIYTDRDGNFSHELLLTPGYNALQVKVTDRFGRVKTKTIKLVYDKREIETDEGFAFMKEAHSDDHT